MKFEFSSLPLVLVFYVVAALTLSFVVNPTPVAVVSNAGTQTGALVLFQYDKNENGYLERDEMNVMFESQFQNSAAAVDGAWTADEYINWRSAVLSARGVKMQDNFQQVGQELFKAHDLNGDGLVRQDEYVLYSTQKLFALFRKTYDGDYLDKVPLMKNLKIVK